MLPLQPRTREVANSYGLSLESESLTVTDPVGYLDITALLAGCVDGLTDSGGLQKEAIFHGKPCVTLRDATE